jgi:O-antigen/teichoic acid export membrane protein
VVNGTLSARAPDLLIGHALGNAAVGLFGRASGLAAQLRTLLSGAVAGVFYPAFARLRDSGAPLAPPYLRVVSCYTALIWPAMAALAFLAEPLILFLYGPVWVGAAPLLQWIALSQMCFAALPLHTELPLLTGRMPALIVRNLIDTGLSLGMLAVGAWWGLQGIALSRLSYGLAWVLLYVGFLRAIAGFGWVALLGAWFRSGLVTLAALAPLLIASLEGTNPAGLTIAEMLGATAAGGLCWLAAVAALRHPVMAEVAAVFAKIRSLAGAAAHPA